MDTNRNASFASQPGHYLGYGYLILLFISGGISTIATKYLMNDGMSPYQALCFSSIMGAVLVALFHYKEGAGFYRFARNRREVLILLGATMLGFVVYEMAYNVALSSMPAQHTTILYYTYPIFLYLASHFWPGNANKGLRLWGIVGILLCFAGAVVMATVGSSGDAGKLSMEGISAMLLAIAAYTAYSMLCKLFLFREAHFVFLGQILSIVFCSGVISAQGGWYMPSLFALGLLLTMALFYNILNQILYIRAINLFSAEKFSALVYFSPVVTCVMAVLFLNEKFTLGVALALGLIISGNVLIAIKGQAKTGKTDKTSTDTAPAQASRPDATKGLVIVVDMESSGVLYRAELLKRGLKILLYYTGTRPEWEALIQSGCVASPAIDTLAEGCEVFFEADYLKLIKHLQSRGDAVAAVIPGSEKGVDVADLLARHYGVPGNDPATIPLRRNKADMKQAAAKAQLRYARYQACHTVQDATTFAAQVGYPMVLKTPSGAGTHNVFVCQNAQELEYAYHRIMDSANIYGQHAAFALAEEYIGGTEYVVDLFGTGQGIVVTDVWRYEKINTEHGNNIYYNVVLEALHCAKHQTLEQYAIELAQAVGILIGPAHAEIKVDENGPVMIEIGSRLPGCKIPFATVECSNFDVVAASVDVFLKGTRPIEAPVVFHKFANVAYLPTNKQGKIVSVSGIEEITQLASYVTHSVDATIGAQLQASTDLTNIPLVGVFVNEGRTRLFDDVARARTLFQIEIEGENNDTLRLPTAIITESRMR
jgi:drug/metabolite transporter (DMT)-like permease